MLCVPSVVGPMSMNDVGGIPRHDVRLAPVVAKKQHKSRVPIACHRAQAMKVEQFHSCAGLSSVGGVG